MLAEQRREFAERFDRVHSIERAVLMGPVKAVVKPPSLRSFLIDAVERGIRRADPSSDRIDGAVLVDERADVMGAQQPAADRPSAARGLRLRKST